jgi:branched-chain amino acid transport system substrate-binding protein
MFSFKRLTTAAAISAVASSLLFALPANASDPGVTPTEITFGAWASLSGVQALTGTSARDGAQLAIDEINAAGGVKGRKLKLVIYDDGGSPQEALSAVRRLLDRDNAFALIGASPSGTTLPAMPVINREAVPMLVAVAAHRNVFKPFAPTAFRIYANEIAQAEAVVSYARAHGGSKRPAIIYNSTDYGVGGSEIVTANLKTNGISVVASEKYNTGDQDFSAQLLRIREQKPDALYLWSFAGEAGIIARQAKELGLDVPMYGGGASTTPLFPAGAGKSGIGFIGPWVFPHTETDNSVPAIAHYRALLDAFYKGSLPAGRPTLYDLIGYGTIKIMAEALNRIEGEPTRKSFVDAMNSIKNFDTGVLFPVTFTPDNHEGSSATSVIEVQSDLTWKIKN